MSAAGGKADTTMVIAGASLKSSYCAAAKKHKYYA